MPLRLIDITCSEVSGDMVQEVVKSHEPLGEWFETLDDGRRRMRVLVDFCSAEELLDELDSLLGTTDLDFRAVIQSVEATLPREEELTSEKQKKRGASRAKRIAREELYTDLKSGAEVSVLYVSQVVLSVVVAAIGLVRNDVAVLIGAMVIAPLLMPNVALTLGATLGDWKLIFQAMRVNLVGIALGFVLAMLVGLAIGVEPDSPALASRTQVDLADVALALAAGTAGALAYTTGAPSSLVGVMVAVAPMPPLVAAGLLLASGHPYLALGAAELLAVNVIGVNLSGVLTFVLQGVRPRNWWEKQRAKKAVITAIVLWLVLLAGLVTIIVMTENPRP